jgi:hypothetical protein
MLSCLYLAGALFIKDGDHGNIYNFHHFQRFSVHRATLSAHTEGFAERFELPEELRNAAPEQVIATCVEQAEIKARHAEQTSLQD